MPISTQSSGQRRATSAVAGSTVAAFALTAGRYAITRTSGIDTISDGTNTHEIIPMGIYRGARIGFGGVGADNATANYRIWLVRFAYARTAQFPNGDPTAVIGCEIEFYIADTSTITLSTYTGIAGDGDVYLDADRIADTITMTLATTATTPAGPATVIETACQLGTAGVYSPANNTPAKLILPHVCGAHGFIIELDMTGATSIKADVELTL